MDFHQQEDTELSKHWIEAVAALVRQIWMGQQFEQLLPV